ncbi:MAG: DsbA family protein, partial [Candidatus Puniceispirillaceae bacterium]
MQSVDVEIYADIICPWCYIGKKRLDAAFAARPHVTPRYIWRCFLLNPTMPSTGMDRQAYLIGKFGNAAKAVYGRIADAGLESGIAFNFDGIQRTPDSRKTHRYLLAAAAKGHDLSDA